MGMNKFLMKDKVGMSNAIYLEHSMKEGILMLKVNLCVKPLMQGRGVLLQRLLEYFLALKVEVFVKLMTVGLGMQNELLEDDGGERLSLMLVRLRRSWRRPWRLRRWRGPSSRSGAWQAVCRRSCSTSRGATSAESPW